MEAAEQTSPGLGVISVFVLGAYLLALLGIGALSAWQGRRSKDAEADYYLAGRGQGLVVTSLTIMATYFSGFAILTFPGWVYSAGIAPMAYALNLPVAAAAIFILGNRIRRLGATHGFITPADMLAHAYGGSRAVRGLVALIGALYVIPYIVIQIKAGGLLAEGLFAGVDSIELLGLTISMNDAGVGALALVAMIYVLLGGMRSVAWTDVVQGLLLLGAMLLSGIAIVSVLGGIGPYFSQVATLDPSLLTMPPAGERFNGWQALTFCAFASLASVVQPGQWMRFYAARDAATLRRTSIIFATILPACFLGGVFLVGLGGRVLYPLVEGGAMGSILTQPDQVVIQVISDTLPMMMGSWGVVLVAVILVAVMAASMSTSDSNLHALSAVFTRDVYHPMRPDSSPTERTWVGRAVIVAATLLATFITYYGANTSLLDTISRFFFMALAFSSQLLPATVDALFVRRGTARGAAAGMVAGLLTVCLFPPLGSLLLGEEHGVSLLTARLQGLLDTGLCALVVNVTVMAAVSRFTAASPRANLS